MNIEEQYLDLLRKVRDEGVATDDRTGTGTLSIFGAQLRHDLSAGFPLLTTKKVFFRGVLLELLWFLRGDTNVRWLQERGVKIWDEWADENGDLGPVYGKQWRSWFGLKWHHEGRFSFVDETSTDQIAKVVESIKTNPHSRRHIVTAWNPANVDQAALPPCHILFQFHVSQGRLSCHMYQRSADLFLGVPFNIASYALLTHMVAQVTGLFVGNLIISFGDAHIYLNHKEQVEEQLSRMPGHSPFLWLNPDVKDIDSFTESDARVLKYNPQPAIPAPVSK